MAIVLRKKGLGRCSHCGLDGVHAKKDGTAFQHCHSRVNGKNLHACLGSGKPLENLIWFSFGNLLDISKEQVNQKVDRNVCKLTQSQVDTLNKLRNEFSLGWFTIKQCYLLPIYRPAFSVKILHRKSYLLRERNPNWKGPLFDDFHRYRISKKIKQVRT